MSARWSATSDPARRTTISRVIAALGLLLWTLAVTGGSPVAGATATGSRMIAVPAYAPVNRNVAPPVGDLAAVWMDAGIALKPGVLVLIRAVGTASCARDWPCSNGPDGSGVFICPAT